MLHTLLVLSCVVTAALGHGRVLSPPGRGSLWRAGFSAPANYDDDGLNCGGFYHQYSVNDGKCGICGDPYDAAEPRAHEIGGTYGSGIISATYESGSVFTATVQISAYHKGFWEFKICPDPSINEQYCFEQYPVELEEGGTKYYPTQSGTYTVNYKLPEGLSCEHCVLQWRYTAGNNWGVCDDGTQGLGCGNQEQFGACSDITITGSSTSTLIQVQNPVESLIGNALNDIGFVQLLINSAIRPHGWEQATTQPTTTTTTTAKPKRKKQKQKHKQKKKGKPYKRKLAKKWRKWKWI